MRKAYRVVGSSFVNPENLPDGMEVRERLVGNVLEMPNGLTFQEIKDGTVVVYHRGKRGSNVKLSRDDQYAAMVFLNRVINEHTVHMP